MSPNQKDAAARKTLREFSLELTPAFEDPELFQARKEEVQILLTDMFLRLHRRGRPKKEAKEKDHAA